MHCTTLLAFVASVTALTTQTWQRETMEEAAVHGRELISFRSDGIGTLMSVFPNDYEDESLRGLAIGLQEYLAPFPNGDLALLTMPISKTFKNALSLPHQNISITIKDEVSEREKGNLWAANRARLTLWGSLRRLSGDEEVEAKHLYEKVHPDAKFWDGVDGPHFSYFTRLEVYKVYYFGGFGDRKAIGWLDMELYRNSIPKVQPTTLSTFALLSKQNTYDDSQIPLHSRRRSRQGRGSALLQDNM